MNPTSNADIPSPAFTPADLDEIAAVRATFPAEGAARSALLPTLWVAQRRFGWLAPSVQRLVATTLGLPLAHVRGVVTFYTMFRQTPTGRHHLQVCRTLSCEMAGSSGILAHLESVLGVKEGETTPDGLFTLTAVECLAACGSGPMMQINEDFYERLTPARVDAILEDLRAGRRPANPEVDEWTWKRES